MIFAAVFLHNCLYNVYTFLAIPSQPALLKIIVPCPMMGYVTPWEVYIYIYIHVQRDRDLSAFTR